MVAEPRLSFADLLRQLRAAARLTQEELAEAAGISPRSVSDLERGINRTARKDTALLLADALSLTGPVRAAFVAAARGRASRPRRSWPPGAGPRPAQRVRGRRDPDAAARHRQLHRPGGGSGPAAGTAGRRHRRRRAVAIHAIDGMAGIGKTTLRGARRARFAGSFPDGQFFLPLHAHTPGQRPVEPGRRAGQPAADGRRRPAAHPARPGGPGRPVARPGGRQEDPAAAG